MGHCADPCGILLTQLGHNFAKVATLQTEILVSYFRQFKRSRIIVTWLSLVRVCDIELQAPCLCNCFLFASLSGCSPLTYTPSCEARSLKWDWNGASLYIFILFYFHPWGCNAAISTFGIPVVRSHVISQRTGLVAGPAVGRLCTCSQVQKYSIHQLWIKSFQGVVTTHHARRCHASCVEWSNPWLPFSLRFAHRDKYGNIKLSFTTFLVTDV